MSIERVFVDVDVQVDFCDPGGALFVKGSPNDLFQKLTSFAVAHKIPIVGSVDSHAWDAWEFASNDRLGPDNQKPNFPDHCVKGTPGWLKLPGTLPPRFRFLPNVPAAPLDTVLREIKEGLTHAVYFEKEVYSFFANPLAEPFLRALSEGSSPDFIVYGVATDFCIKSAVLGLAERGFRTTLLEDAVAGITPEGTAKALADMKAAGVKILRSSDVLGG
ncbi:MAG: isochorismatase family protein [Polyangiaceae bacterium]|nr:isochorismatase family protein [Polyangiaceae bacterium]NUQ72200.1 isochorismatase family protein [Polyangiaceae bacterium]